VRSRLGSLTAVDCAHSHDTAQDSDSHSRHDEKRRGRSENGQSGNRPEGGVKVPPTSPLMQVYLVGLHASG
jgi:hypothetical protein